LQNEAVRLDALAASCTKAISLPLDGAISNAVIAPTIMCIKSRIAECFGVNGQPQKIATGTAVL